MNQGLFLHVFVWILARQTVRKTDRGCFLWLDSVTSEEREQEVTVPSCSVTTWKKPENKVQLQMPVAAQEINLDAAGFLELSYIVTWIKKKSFLFCLTGFWLGFNLLQNNLPSMQYVSSPTMKSQNNKIVVGKKKKWQLKCGWQKEQNSCASLFQEQILKDKKKRHKYYQISFQSFPVSVLVLRLEPVSDPLLEILKQEVKRT